MSKAKTSTERGRERKERLKKKGYKEIRNLWAKPDNEPYIRLYADKLDKQEKRDE